MISEFMSSFIYSFQLTSFLDSAAEVPQETVEGDTHITSGELTVVQLIPSFKSHFLRISRIERHSQKIEFFFILPKHHFG